MGQVFSQADAALARYWYERRVYTYGPLSLQPGYSTIFTASPIAPDPQHPDWQAALLGMWVTNSPYVQLTWIADDAQEGSSVTQGWTDAARAGLRRIAVFAPAVRQLTLTAYNTSTSAISNFTLVYEIGLKRLTVAEKLLYGYGLTPSDLARIHGLQLSDVQALVERGTAPVPIEQEIVRTLDNQMLGEYTGASGLWHAEASTTTAEASTTTAGVPFASVQVKTGEVAVLREVAIEGAAPVQLYVDRDGDLGLLTLNGAAFTQANDAPWQPFLIALNTFQFRVVAQTTTTAPIRLRVTRHPLNSLWRVRTGVAAAADDVPGDAFAKVWAGIV